MRISELKKQLGSKIKERREMLDISQDELARRVSRSRATIANIERGSQGVDIVSLYLFAEKLDTTPDKLLPEYRSNYLRGVNEKVRTLVEEVIEEAKYA